MIHDTQRLIDAVEAGEMTDPGGMTTTRDVADVVPHSFEDVEEALRALDRDGAIESTTFGSDRVWTVLDEADSRRDRPTPSADLFTTTRVPQTS